MKESKIGTGCSKTPESKQEKKVLMVKHDGKEFIFSHVNNQFFPTFAFLKEARTDNIITVPWEDLEEEARKNITDHFEQLKGEAGETEKTYPYDRELYFTLLNAPKNVKDALQEQARQTAIMGAAFASLTMRHIDKQDEQPVDLLKEVAMGIATAKKEKKEYGRAFAPTNANLILEWLKNLNLNPQKSHDRISVDFSDQEK